MCLNLSPISPLDSAGGDLELVERSHFLIRTLPKGHRFAGFAVLRAPDVPSVLIEMGYLSNKGDERQLGSPDFQGKLVDAVVRAADSYFGKLAKR